MLLGRCEKVDVVAWDPVLCKCFVGNYEFEERELAPNRNRGIEEAKIRSRR